jgi:hypothetical protein
MAGLPKHYAKMGFKKGWRAFKARHHLRGECSGMEGTKKHHGGRRKVHPAFWLDGDMSAPALVRAPVKRLSSITPGKVLSPIIDLALIILGMGVAAGIKKVSPVKNPHIMNAGGGVVGIGGSLITRNRFIKLPLIGVALQSAISETKTLWPNLPLAIAGDDEVIYLPTSGDEPMQIEYQGDDSRVGAVVDGDDSRVGAVVDGDEEVRGEDDMEGDEGRNA